MSEEELIRKSNISFGRNLGLQETNELLFYLAGELNLGIRYEVKDSKTISISGRSRNFWPTSTGLEVSGSISPSENYRDLGCFLANFNSYKESFREPTKIEGIRFFTAPGDGLNDISQGEIKLFEDVQKKVSKFIEDLEERI